MMRKMHYNEGLNIKMARQLIEEEDDEDEEMKEDAEMEDVSENPPQDGKGLSDDIIAAGFRLGLHVTSTLVS